MDDETLLKEKRFGEYKRVFIDCVANALSDIIINYWEPVLIKRIIRENYFFFNIIEQNRIYDFTQNVLDYNESSGKLDLSFRVRRKTFVSRKIQEYLNSNSTIILDVHKLSFKRVYDAVEEMVDIATDEYLIDKEYRNLSNCFASLSLFRNQKRFSQCSFLEMIR